MIAWADRAQKTPLAKIYEQYDVKREGKDPWVLRHGGQLADLNDTVGSFSSSGDNLVVFVAATASGASGLTKSSVDAANPLSPKDPNSRTRPTPMLPKPTTITGSDENSLQPATNAHLNSFGRQIRSTPSPSPMALPANLSRSSSSAPQQGPGSALYVPQHRAHTPLVKMERGKFPEYRDTWIDWYRKNYPTLTHGMCTTSIIWS